MLTCVMKSVIGKWIPLSVRKSRAKLFTCSYRTHVPKRNYYQMAGKTAACTVRALDILQRRYGADFPRIFKTITVDNGCEFADVKGIEKDGRTQLYFCHPYSSWERGSNENLNKMIRRFVPKGFSINKVSRKQVHRIQTFMNSYPRKILGWRCADDVFMKRF